MKHRRIGSLEVSVVGLGGNSFGTDFFGARCDQREVTRIVNAALDAGVNLIDTAEEYSITSFLGEGHSEELIGAALGRRRDEAVIATKFLNSSEADPQQRGPARIIAAAEASLRRLGTDRIDLYQQHQPDPDTPIEETLEALDRLVGDGKVREVGCCNFTADMLDAATDAANRSSLAPFRSSQVQFRLTQMQYSLLERPSDDVLGAAQRNAMVILAYFPLASGLLTGKYRRGEPPPSDSRLASDGPVSAMLRQGILADPAAPIRRAAGDGRTAVGVRGGAGPLAAGAGGLVAGRPTPRGIGHRRGDQSGTGSRQCRRRGLGSHGRRPHRGRDSRSPGRSFRRPSRLTGSRVAERDGGGSQGGEGGTGGVGGVAAPGGRHDLGFVHPFDEYEVQRQGPADHQVESGHRTVTGVLAAERHSERLGQICDIGHGILELQGRLDRRAVEVGAVGDQLSALGSDGKGRPNRGPG